MTLEEIKAEAEEYFEPWVKTVRYSSAIDFAQHILELAEKRREVAEKEDEN